jgi:hypothetical protein
MDNSDEEEQESVYTVLVTGANRYELSLSLHQGKETN